ncbi:MAG: HAMP domain-containing histidine kinase [Gammaproteobacteria bacterium]|nr:HAMP domain-containing histidine kinase [Gammaproteobacteria bacterium]
MGSLLFTIAGQLTEQFVLSRLQHDGESLLSAVNFDAQGQLKISGDRLSDIYERPLSGHYYQVLTKDAAPVVSRSLWDTTLQANLLVPGEVSNWLTIGPDDQHLLIWSAAYLKQQQSITIVVAENLSPLQQTLTRYSAALTGLTFVFLIILLLIQRYIVRRSFRPLDKLSNEIAQLEAGEIDQLTERVPDEVRPLVIEVNRLLSLMGRRLQRSRTALGNLAHALKAPLNLLTQLADSEAVRALPELKQELKEYSGQLSQLIDHELKRARLAGSGGAAQRFDAADELPPMIELLKRIYSDRHINIDASYPQTPIQNLDRNDMTEMLGNLLDNACKWARHKIICRIEVTDFVTVIVEDDGVGVTEQQLEKLTQRGSRIDESLPGHGLGLSIVNEIVELYHGSLQLEHSEELGGLCVTAKLKLTSSG